MHNIKVRGRDSLTMRSMIITQQNMRSISPYPKIYPAHFKPADKFIKSSKNLTYNQTSFTHNQKALNDKDIHFYNKSSKKLITDTSEDGLNKSQLLQKVCLSLQNQQKRINLITQKLQMLQRKCIPTGKNLQQCKQKIKVNKQFFNENNFMHTANAQIYQYMFNFRLDLEGIKQQINKYIKSEQLKLFQTQQQQQINKFYIELNNKINSLQQDNKLSKQKLKDYSQYIKRQKFLIDKTMNKASQSIMVTYRQLLEANNIQQTIKEYVYYVDTQGYLLDNFKSYIINAKSQKIQIQKQQLETLKKMTIIK